MSNLSVNTITNAAGGDTAQINGMTPTGDSLQGFRNRILNGGMVIDQRNAGAAVTAGSGYTLDRWNVDRVWAGSTVTIQQSSVAPTGFTNSLLATVSTGAASASNSYFSVQQYIEGNNISDLELGTAGAQTFTVSFWVRSSVTGTFGVCFRNSAFNLSYCTTYSISAANTWEQKFETIDAPTSGTFGTGNSYGLNVIFSLGGGSSAKPASNNAWVAGSFVSPIGQTDLIGTSGATWQVTGCQLEAGAVATPFERRPFGAELALCQRYCPAYPTTTAVTPNEELPIAGSGINSTVVYGLFEFPVPTRVPVTGVTVSSASHFTTSRPSTGNIVATAIAFRSGGSQSASINITIASGGVADVPYFVFANNASARIVFNGAEL